MSRSVVAISLPGYPVTPSAALARPNVPVLADSSPLEPDSVEVAPPPSPETARAFIYENGKITGMRSSGLLSAMTAGDRRAMGIAMTESALPDGFPNPLYANFNDFLADYPNRKWLEEGSIVVIDRHAKSICNVVGFLQGASESPLVAAGLAQSSTLGKTLFPLPIDTIYTSPIGRSVETANAMVAGMAGHPQVVLEPDLAELNLGLLEWRPDPMTSAELDAFLESLFDPVGRETFKVQHGLTDVEVDLLRDASVKQRDLVRAEALRQGISEDELVQRMLKVLEDVDYHPPGGGQSFRELAERVSREKTRLDGAEFDGRAVALVSHGMPDRLLIMEMLGLPFTSIEEISTIPQSNAGITLLWRPKGSDDWQLLVLNSKSDGS